jgi:membrane associated rhomboid family serine protease
MQDLLGAKIYFSRTVRKPFPIVSTSLTAATLIASSTIAMMARGRPWSSVPILQLLNYGGVDNSHLASGEWWLLLSAQFVHVKQMHMVFNVTALFLLGFAVERVTGPFRFGVLWLLSGVVGTFASIYSVAPPYDIGSGASQALMGIAAAAIIVI